MPSTPSSSRQHPHLPPHLGSATSAPSGPSASSPTPALPIEPSDSRQQAYSYSQNLGGRRGSTDPLLHASMAASATANMAAQHHHHSQTQQHAGHGSSDSPFATSAAGNAGDAHGRKRNAAAAMLDNDGAAPGQRFNSSMATNSPGSKVADATNSGPEHERRPSLSGLSAYNPFGSWPDSFATNTATTGNHDPESFFANLPGAPSNGEHKHGVSLLGGGSSHAGGGGAHSTSTHPFGAHAAQQGTSASSADADEASGGIKSSLPYARSPELRVSHKLAERKRRKEMKDLFDDLKTLLPNEAEDSDGKSNGSGSKNKDLSKLSKWEVLSRAVEHINRLNYTQSTLLNEVQKHRSQLGLPPYQLPVLPKRSSEGDDQDGGSDK